MAIEIVFVGIDGVEGRNAWEVAPVLLDCQGDGSLEDGHMKCWWGCLDELYFIVVSMGAPFPFLIVGDVSVDVVYRESKSHAFVGWLSGQKDCLDADELCAVVGEWGPIVAQDNGRR
jgi:hypothetical protein